MTYPVDDNGNPRVDFVWGNFPLQPDDQRGTYNTNRYRTNQDQNKSWTNSKTIGSDYLAVGWTTLDFGTGDGGNTRQQTFTWDNHEIAQSNYEDYPSFAGGYPYDDTIPNVTVPDLINLANPTAAQTALQNAGLVLGNSYNTTVGATAQNDLYVKSQSIAPGTLVNLGTPVDITTYHYVVPANPIAGININSFPGHPTPGAGQVYMFLIGRTVKPTAGDTIVISGNSNSTLNQNWHVDLVEDNDSYNSGGTVCTITAQDQNVYNPNTNSGGTWRLA
jgi:hypothetical protein